MENILQNFGFTKNEARVYLSVHSTPLNTGVEYSKKLHMDKSSVYKALDRLRSQGIITSSPGDKGIVYKASSPDSLKDLIKQREIKLKQDSIGLNELIKSLKDKSASTRETYITVEHGLKALQFRMTESLQCKEKFMREQFRHHKIFDIKSHVTFVKKHANERVDKKIMLYQIEDNWDKFHKTFKSMLASKKSSYKEVRGLPKGFENNNSIRIWDDTINIFSFDNEGEFIIITIKDKFVADLMKNFYDFIWKNAKKLPLYDR